MLWRHEELPQALRSQQGLRFARGRERRIRLSLPTTLGVPRGLPVSDDEDASGEVGRRAVRGRRTGHQPEGIVVAVATLRLFASAREAAGRSRDTVPGNTVAEVLHEATSRYGHGFAALLETCKVWVNGEEATADQAVTDADEVAVLPPVSGG